MKVLFLDIDGVLLAGRHWEEKRRERLPPDTIALLNEICERSGVVVVISSVWRFDDKLRRRLHSAGFKGRFHRDWRTPSTGYSIKNILSIEGNCRGDEIADWLKRNPVEGYCIIDDDSDMLDEQKKSFINTDFKQGLCKEHVDQVLLILGVTDNDTK